MSERYSRQISIIGEEGQKKLRNSKVVVTGIGGLGSVASYYLAAAGVGYLRIIDYDVVEISNLNRQILHWTNDIGRPKVESAAMKLSLLNPETRIDPINEKISEDNVDELLKGMDVIIDGQDNLRTRMIINEFAVRSCRPYVYGAVYGMEGFLMTIIPGAGPCLRCLYPYEPKIKDFIPVLGTTPGVIGCLEATEAIKIITGVGKPSVGRLIIYDGENMSFHEVCIARNSQCYVCKKI
ncbi:MAG: HesA/MoeB/ThiF family protein [Candidatus Methanomethyliaceae archaeon]|nr:HesA/MoeB/ThiF family protein [Candidatus Methanomethyliaceae archaeon]MDW7971373.1 HesA/MoeB/ThiF family protein [Nitrososphaerota archaeon]